MYLEERKEPTKERREGRRIQGRDAGGGKLSRSKDERISIGGTF